MTKVTKSLHWYIFLTPHSKLWSNFNLPSSCMRITSAVPPTLVLNYTQHQDNLFYLPPKRVDLAGNTKMVCISFTSTSYPDVLYDMYYKPIHEKMYIPITNHSCLQHSDVYNDVSTSKCVLVWQLCSTYTCVCAWVYIIFIAFKFLIQCVHSFTSCGLPRIPNMHVYLLSLCESVCCWHDNTSQTLLHGDQMLNWGEHGRLMMTLL